MSIDQTKIIDLIGIGKVDKNVYLTISDHLDWEDPENHIFLLQEKLNSYLAYIESGEIFEDDPSRKGREIIIDLVINHQIPKKYEYIYNKIAKVIGDAGFTFTIRSL